MKASCTKVVPTNWNTYISASLYPLVLPIESIESITWAHHRGWGRQRFIEGDPFAHVWPQQPNQAMQSKTNTALQTDSKFFKYIASTEHYCVVVLVVDRGGGRAEGQLRGEYGWAGRSRAGRQGRAQPGFSGILFPHVCIVHKAHTSAQSNGFVALNDWQRLRRLSDIGAAVVGQGQSRPRLFPLQNSFRC